MCGLWTKKRTYYTKHVAKRRLNEPKRVANGPQKEPCGPRKGTQWTKKVLCGCWTEGHALVWPIGPSVTRWCGLLDRVSRPGVPYWAERRAQARSTAEPGATGE